MGKKKLNKIFQRKEKKYHLSYGKYNQLIKELDFHMTRDEYGLHTINSLYYDTVNYDLISLARRKPNYREKLRIRCYGTDYVNAPYFLEIKKKVNKVIYKRRVNMNFYQVNDFINHGLLPINNSFSDELTLMEVKRILDNNVFPSVMVIYDRIALFDNLDPNFRVTFDFNMRWRKDRLNFLHDDSGSIIAPEVDVIMEVKILKSYPLWFSQLLSELKIFPQSFSKFGEVYKRYILKERFTNEQYF